MKVKLTGKYGKGRHVLVSKVDFSWAVSYKWRVDAGGYVITGKSMRIHREILKRVGNLRVFPQNRVTDHINGNKLDNRRKNLRICTQGQNNLNRPADRKSTSKFKGVCRIWSRKNPWQAQIRIKQKTVYLGRFKTEIEAAKAYDDVAKKHHKAFAFLNFNQKKVQ